MKDELVFRDKVFFAIRNVISLAPKLGLMKKPRHHKDGITFIVAVKDEERWIKLCIQSIQDAADEIIVVDSSVEDNTSKIVESLATSNTKIKHIKFYGGGFNAFALALHIGLVSASYKWIFKWDSDLIAKSPEAMKEWINKLEHLDKNRYYVIDIPRINLVGDLEHQSRSRPFGDYEGRLFTWSPELRWLVKVNCFDQITGDSIWGHRFPLYFNSLRWHEPNVFHCDIKSPKRSLIRRYWLDYMSQRETRFTTLEEYAAYRIHQDRGISMEEGIKEVMDLIAKDSVPYDKNRFGELPDLLKK
jgi:glycosyltransferase involved in cell wall biosynthesis